MFETMLDFTHGTTWFAAGLTTTIILTLILSLVVAAATWAEYRH